MQLALLHFSRPRLSSALRRVFVGLATWCVVACHQPYTQGDRATLVPPRKLRGLTECSTAEPPRLDGKKELVILVHGCNSSAARFTTLAEVFAYHGQKAICFSYDYRDSLVSSAEELNRAIAELTAKQPVEEITVLAHSQGGLVARAALVPSQSYSVPQEVSSLITISTPFAGIRASKDCGKLALHILTMGITVAACQAIAGRKWTEIHPKAPFILEPGNLAPTVESHYLIATDERHACLRSEQDTCVKDDYVFSLREQAGTHIESGRLSEETLVSGHSSVVGESGKAPKELIAALQREGILAPTPIEHEAHFEAVLEELYASAD